MLSNQPKEYWKIINEQKQSKTFVSISLQACYKHFAGLNSSAEKDEPFHSDVNEHENNQFSNAHLK